MKYLVIIAATAALAFGAEVDKFITLSDGWVVGVIAKDKTTIQISQDIKTVIWTGTNGNPIKLNWDGKKLVAETL